MRKKIPSGLTIGLAALGLALLGAAVMKARRAGGLRRLFAAPDGQLPRAGLIDSLKVLLGVVTPTVAMGPIIRRPKVMRPAERLDFAGNAVKAMQKLRDDCGNGPLMIAVPFRHQAVLLDPAHVRRVLDETPEPFATASTEKQAALRHFEPKGALISHGHERTVRRRINEETLQHSDPIHSMSDRFLSIVDEEIHELLDRANPAGELRWSDFYAAWFRIVRRVAFGSEARDDEQITILMEKLRAAGNWAFFRPVRSDLRAELHGRIRHYLDKSEPGSLAALMSSRVKTSLSEPENQIPQWLFAFDPAGMATFRGLALLTSHSTYLERAHEEAESVQSHRPLLRATILESLRLWPTTPMILRQTTRETKWEHGIMPARTGILIYAPFFHRDETRIPFAHAFNPDLWIQDDPEVKGDAPRAWPFVPFSSGTGVCPGRNLVLLLTSNTLARILARREIQLQQPWRMQPGKLPGTLDHFTLRFLIGPEAQAVSAMATG
jgi:cytochrome P450